MKTAELQAVAESTMADILEWHRMPDGDEKWDAASERPLSVLFRSGWSSGPEWTVDGGEVEILLGTGGPAVRIMADIDGKKGIVNPRIEAQNWGIPWTECTATGEQAVALRAFASHFNAWIPGGEL